MSGSSLMSFIQKGAEHTTHAGCTVMERSMHDLHVWVGEGCRREEGGPAEVVVARDGHGVRVDLVAEE